VVTPTRRASHRAARSRFAAAFRWALMDPDAALDELLGLVDLMAGDADADSGQRINRHEILRMTELVEGLDSWLTAGGFLPRRWRSASRRSA
jgi:hypothetical protein